MIVHYWSGKRSEFIAWYKQKSFTNFFDALEYNSKNIIRLTLAEKFEELFDFLRHGSLVLGSFREKIIGDDIEKRALFEIGRVYGVLQLSKLIYQKKEKEQQVKELTYLSYQVKHLNDIINLLNTKHQLTHSQICDELNMQPSTLSECMKKILPTGLVECTRLGQFKLYFLTSDGIRFAKNITGTPVVLGSYRHTRNNTLFVETSYSFNSFTPKKTNKHWIFLDNYTEPLSLPQKEKRIRYTTLSDDSKNTTFLDYIDNLSSRYDWNMNERSSI